MENALDKSDNFPFSNFRFSLTTNDIKELLDIFESFKYALQPIFESLLQNPNGTMWNLAQKLGQNPGKKCSKFPQVF